MSAGLSKKQIYTRVYTRLMGIQHKLFLAGYHTNYARSCLWHYGKCVVSYRILHASNGEVAGIPEYDKEVKGLLGMSE